MTQEQAKQIEITLGILARMQSTLNGIDSLAVQTKFMHDLKRKTKQYESFLEKSLKPFYKNQAPKEIDKVIEVVGRIDEVCNELTIENY